MTIPCEAIHPSEFINDELEARGWSISDLATRSLKPGEIWGIQALALDMYLTVGDLEPDMRLGALATDIARAFDVDADLFVNLERAYLEHPNTKRRRGEAVESAEGSHQ